MADDNDGGLPDRLSAYLAFRAAWPERFAAQPDGVAIVTDLAGIAETEQIMGRAYEQRGWPRAWAEVGLLYEDPYLVLLREAVRFPDGSPGVHHRILRRAPDPSGVAVMPLLDGRIVLVRHYRHATRCWMWELPRGALDPGEGAADAAVRELGEEVGAEVVDVVALGTIHAASSVMGMPVALMAARVAGLGAPALGEGIDGHRVVTAAEMEAMIRAGEITDAYTLGCFLHARLRGVV